MEQLLQGINDPNLRFTLEFGIGLHHAGLHEKDRKIVEELFVNQKIHVSTDHIHYTTEYVVIMRCLI